MTVRAALLVVLLLATPLAAAQVQLPAPDGVDPVLRHELHDSAKPGSCKSERAAGASAPSGLMERRANGASGTTFTLRIAPSATAASCEGFEFTFDAPLSWPPPHGLALPFTADCGATGTVGFQRSTAELELGFLLQHVPQGCGLSAGPFSFLFLSVPAPVGGSQPDLPNVPCVSPGWGCGVSEQHDDCFSRTRVDLLFASVYGYHARCGGEHWWISGPLTAFHATRDACRLGVSTPEHPTTWTSCPEPVAPLVAEVLAAAPWGRLLP